MTSSESSTYCQGNCSKLGYFFNDYANSIFFKLYQHERHDKYGNAINTIIYWFLMRMTMPLNESIVCALCVCVCVCVCVCGGGGGGERVEGGDGGGDGGG